MIRASGLWVADAATAEQMQRERRYTNPAWVHWSRTGGRAEPDRYLDVSRRWGRWTILPREWPTDGAPQDRTCYPEAARVRQYTWQLRDYQRSALEAWTGCGVIVAPCGAGKTAIGSAAIASRRTPALVLVHTRDLVRQWVERLQDSHSAPEVGIVGGGKDERSADVVVATLQTLARWPFDELIEWGKGRGLVVVDECHHIPAATFGAVMLGLGGRERLGLTATPERADGLEGLITDHLGPVCHRIEAHHLQASGATLTPEIRILHTEWEADPLDKPYQRRRALATDSGRNWLIWDAVRSQVEQGRRVLVLCDLKQHCRDLAAACGGVAVTSDLTAKQRRKAFAGLRSGAVGALFATSLADEGLDLPELDTVILAAPCGLVGKVEQRIGRALRPADNKGRPLVIDLVDKFGPFQGYARRRAKLYRQRGWM